MSVIQLQKSGIEHPKYAKFKSRYKLIRDSVAGKEDIDEGGTTYLPKPNSYTDDRYTSYQTRAVFYNATARTLEGYLGAIFRKEATIDLPSNIGYLKDDTDGEGNTIVQFGKKVCRDVIAMGRHGILVDFPQANGIRTLKDERDANLQAHLISYSPESIVNWKTVKRGAKTILSSVLLEESNLVSDGVNPFDQDGGERWRMLQLDENGHYVQHVMSEMDVQNPKTLKMEKRVVVEETITPILPNGKPMTYIPFVFIGSETFTPEPDLPPLYDLAQLNVAHYRNSADWEQAVFMVGQPTPWISGLDDGFIEQYKNSLVIGSNVAWLLPDGAVAGILESKSDKNMIQKAMEVKEAEMIGPGARIVQDNTSRGSEATESVQLRRSGESSQLACISDNVSQAMVKAFGWANEWMGGKTENIVYQLNKDFFGQRLSHQDIAALVSAWQSGAIPHDILLDNLRTGEVISELETNEQVKGKIEADGPPLGMVEATPVQESVDDDESGSSDS